MGVLTKDRCNLVRVSKGSLVDYSVKKQLQVAEGGRLTGIEATAEIHATEDSGGWNHSF